MALFPSYKRIFKTCSICNFFFLCVFRQIKARQRAKRRLILTAVVCLRFTTEVSFLNFYTHWERHSSQPLLRGGAEEEKGSFPRNGVTNRMNSRSPPSGKTTPLYLTLAILMLFIIKYKTYIYIYFSVKRSLADFIQVVQVVNM